MITQTRPAGATRKRSLVAVALAVVTTFVLTACMRMNVDVTLHEDDTVTGSMVFAFSDDVAEMMGMSPDELWAMAADDMNMVDDMPRGSTQEDYSQDGFTGTRITLPAAPIDEFGGSGADEMTITREGDYFVLDGIFELPQDGLDEVPAAMLNTMDISFSFTFPGPVVESNGSMMATP